MSERPIEHWNRLRVHEPHDGVMEVPSLASHADAGFGPVRFAIGSRGQPRLLVPCGAGARLKEDGSNGRLIKTISRYQVSGKWMSFIDVMCASPGLDSVFSELSGEIVRRIGEGRGPVVAVEGAIDDFRSLFRDKDVLDVADHQILGLVGELAVLRLLTEASPSAVHAWTGPFGQRHDFRRKSHAMEVKTSGRVDAASVSISSIEQLSDPADGSLTLVHVRAERADGGRLSVTRLVAEIVELGAPRPALEDALRHMGCHDPWSAEWNRISWDLEGLDAYRVRPGFPRVTSGQFEGGVLPVGVDSVAYVIDLASAAQFKLGHDEFDRVRKEMLA
ncbi:PD-(D/E)XK motif protein [Luteimonas chenhongjianii]|nr:PD-(D/E)XK motif protein [Luteimonas chenhongjianii]